MSFLFSISQDLNCPNIHLFASRDEKNDGDSQAERDTATVSVASIHRIEESKPSSQSSTSCAYCKCLGTLAYICKKCKTATYCDHRCFNSHWHRHKFDCNLGRPIDATDYLVLSCYLAEFPQDEDTVKVYGFMSFASAHDMNRLFNLYRRLIIEYNLDEEELRSAVKQDKLKEMLVFRCSQFRDPLIASDILWLQRDPSFRANGQSPGLLAALDTFRQKLLSSEDFKVPTMKLQPLAKRQALLFYTQIHHGFRPSADEDNWIQLGFCTAVNLASENKLAWAYELLIRQCRFDEFWDAIATSTMVELFSKYGLASHIKHRRNFISFMSAVGNKRESVWHLKQFIRMSQPDPFHAVIVDYGFMNCKDPYQRMQLKGLYQRLFERGVDEKLLHEACVAGKLADFLESVVGSVSLPRELLQNPYPEANHPLSGMVVDSLISCPQSLADTLRDEDTNSKIVPHPDDIDDEMLRMIEDKAAFLGTPLRKRYYSTSDGKRVMELVME